MNPDIANIGKETQFGGSRANPRSAAAWSIRKQIRYLAAQEVDEADPDAFKPKGKMTRAQRIAMRTLQKADEGDIRAAEFVDERIEGKLPQTNINADIDKIMQMTDDELRAFHAGITNSVTPPADHAIGSGHGDEAARDDHPAAESAAAPDTAAEVSGAVDIQKA